MQGYEVSKTPRINNNNNNNNNNDITTTTTTNNNNNKGSRNMGYGRGSTFVWG